jgi:uncharacterized protein YkwD
MRTAIGLWAAALLAIGAAPAAAACPDADVTVEQATIQQARAAIRCLLDAERADAGLHRYKISPKLTRIAKRYAKRMRDDDFFGHTTPDGQTRADRYRAAGYDHRGGENLGFGWTTVRQLVEQWMGSGIHRHNILSHRWHYIGIGIAVGGSRGRLYTVTFGPARS